MTILVRSGVVAASRRYALELVRPSSVAFSGTSADIVGLGSVDFSACTAVSLNGVFSAEYDNYMISIRHSGSQSINEAFRFRLRLSGTDNSTASSYVRQFLRATSTTIQGGRLTDDFGTFGNTVTTQRDGTTVYIYGPALAQPTAYRTVSVVGTDSAEMADIAGTHNQSTSYDGITLYVATGTVSGNVAVYGLRV